MRGYSEENKYEATIKYVEILSEVRIESGGTINLGLSENNYYLIIGRDGQGNIKSWHPSDLAPDI